MTDDGLDYPAVLPLVRQQLQMSQEDLAREIGVSFNTVNRWEKGKVKPSKLAKNQLSYFLRRMTTEGRLKLPKKFMIW